MVRKIVTSLTSLSVLVHSFDWLSLRLGSRAQGGVWALRLRVYWVAVKELNSSYYIGETLLFTIYTHYGNLI